MGNSRTSGHTRTNFNSVRCHNFIKVDWTQENKTYKGTDGQTRLDSKSDPESMDTMKCGCNSGPSRCYIIIGVDSTFTVNVYKTQSLINGHFSTNLPTSIRYDKMENQFLCMDNEFNWTQKYMDKC